MQDRTTTPKQRAKRKPAPPRPTLDGKAASITYPEQGPAVVKQTRGPRFAKVDRDEARRVMANGCAFTTSGASFGWAKGV